MLRSLFAIVILYCSMNVSAQQPINRGQEARTQLTVKATLTREPFTISKDGVVTKNDPGSTASHQPTYVREVKRTTDGKMVTVITIEY